MKQETPFERSMRDAPVTTAVTYFGCLGFMLAGKLTLFGLFVVAVVYALRWMGVL